MSEETICLNCSHKISDHDRETARQCAIAVIRGVSKRQTDGSKNISEHNSNDGEIN